MPKKMEFSLNHMTSPKLRYDEVLLLASRLGCIGVEFRNDLPGALFDGDAPEKVRSLAKNLNLRILGISEVKMFNVWSDARRDEAAKLIAVAQELGAESISLIPRCDGQGLGRAERQNDLRVALRELLPMVRDAGLVGLVEPLGFARSSLRFKKEAMEAIDEVSGRGIFKLVHDTFHHAIAGESELYYEDTGIVHVSGVTDSIVDIHEMRDSHRILVDSEDRLGNVVQLVELTSLGYAGPVSYEAFSPLVHEETKSFEAIKTSIEYLTHAVEGPKVG